jgi:hypothetical protein
MEYRERRLAINQDGYVLDNQKARGDIWLKVQATYQF